jgi:hypothetical protein
VKKQIVIAGPVMSSLVDLSLLLDKSTYSVFLIEARRPTQRLLVEGAGDPDAMVVYLSGEENVVDLRRLLDAYPGTRFLFLAPAFPPHAAISRIAMRYGATLLRQEEGPLVVVATLVALMASISGASA